MAEQGLTELGDLHRIVAYWVMVTKYKEFVYSGVPLIEDNVCHLTEYISRVS